MVANRVLAECSSTNDLARELGDAGHLHGTWIAARRQTKGRGRRGREWRSEPGNLFASWVIRPDAPVSNWTWLPLAAGAATCAALERLDPGVDVRIKWPNDLWRNEKKVGGILCEAHANHTNPFLVVGIGLNCRTAPAGLDQPTAALGHSFELVLEALASAIPESLRAIDPQSISEQVMARAALPVGVEVQWNSGRGRVLGLGSAGELRVEKSDGSEVKLVAEDVSLLRSAR